MSKSQIDQRTAEGGKLTLFRKPHPKTGVVLNNWYCTIKLERGQPRTRISCQSSDYETALSFARKEMFRRQSLLEQGLSPVIKSFKHIASDFLVKMRTEVIKGSQSKANIDYYERVINNTLIPFFGNKNIQSINSLLIDEYDNYRINKRSPITGNVVKNTTLNRESVVLRKILQFSKDRGFVVSTPKIKTLKEVMSNRPALSKEAWESFNKFLRIWCNDLPKDDDNNIRDTLTNYYREALRDYVQFLCYTGLRCGECSVIKYKDVSYQADQNNNKYAVINVRAEEIGARKTGSRKAIGLDKYIETIIKRRKKASGFNGDNDYIFAHPIERIPSRLQGTRIKSFKKSFNNAVYEWSKYDTKLGTTEINGERITLGMWRHQYAHFRLSLAKVDIYHLAISLGHSVSVCEKYYSHSRPEQFGGELGRLIDTNP